MAPKAISDFLKAILQALGKILQVFWILLYEHHIYSYIPCDSNFTKSVEKDILSIANLFYATISLCKQVCAFMAADPDSCCQIAISILIVLAALVLVYDFIQDGEAHNMHIYVRASYILSLMKKHEKLLIRIRACERHIDSIDDYIGLLDVTSQTVTKEQIELITRENFVNGTYKFLDEQWFQKWAEIGLLDSTKTVEEVFVRILKCRDSLIAKQDAMDVALDDIEDELEGYGYFRRTVDGQAEWYRVTAEE